MNIENELMALEEKILSPIATLSKNSRGRLLYEPYDTIRTPFMRDRDRIIHAKAFRRLKHKTQVFVSPENDHYRTRLTHTLEVMQIAKSVGRALHLNEDLIEAIALGHDVGHTPFAHCGEEVLNSKLKKGFRHNENSVRVLKEIEIHGNKRGLNLSWEVLDGILHHSGFGKSKQHATTIEGQIIRFADKIAYVQHDIDDSIRAGILQENDLPSEAIEILGRSLGERITTLVTDLIYEGRKIDFKNPNKVIGFSKPIHDALLNLRKFMFKEVYLGEVCSLERERASYVVDFLYDYYFKNIDKMPKFYQTIVEKDGREQAVCDYISGMTDNYCVYLFKKLTIPRSFVSQDLSNNFSTSLF